MITSLTSFKMPPTLWTLRMLNEPDQGLEDSICHLPHAKYLLYIISFSPHNNTLW